MSHRTLTRREREIMDAVFALGNRASAEDIRARLTDPPGDSSVRVMLARLEKKACLKHELDGMIEIGSQRVIHQDWQSRSRLYKAAIWIAYGIVRVGMGLLGYGGEEWFPKRARARRVETGSPG